MNVFVLNTKEDILKETQQFWGTIDSHSIIFPAMEVNGAQNCCFLQNIFLCVQQMHYNILKPNTILTSCLVKCCLNTVCISTSLISQHDYECISASIYCVRRVKEQIDRGI